MDKFINERLGHALEWCKEQESKLERPPRHPWIVGKEEYLIGYLKEWGKNNPEKQRAIWQRGKAKRRARERLLINTLTAQEWIDILKKYKFKCAYCGKEFTLFDRETKDHVIPISKGGNNTRENIVPACRSCNSKKHTALKLWGIT